MFSVSIQQRYVVVALMFISLTITMALRISFPIALTQMVYIPNAEKSKSVANNELICPVQYSLLENNSSNLTPTLDKIININHGRYNWSQKLQGTILSSYSFGTILAEIPGSILVLKYGAKLVLLTSVGLSTLVTFLTPLLVEYASAYGLLAIRILLGITQGPVFPCLSAFAAAWYPVGQRGGLCSLGYIGIAAGGVLATYASGTLMHLTNRWDVVFYFFSLISILYWVIMFYFCYDRPEKNPFISEAEKCYLNRQINDFNNENSEVPPTPWKSMLFCPPVIALSFSIALYSWSFYIVNIDLPKYLNDVLHVSIQKNGIYSSVPRILSIVISLASGFIGDLMNTKCKISRTCVRKTFVILTSVIPATFLILSSYAGCDELLAVTYLSISIAGHGFNSAGAAINLFDLSPNYAPSLNAVINSIATIVGILAPYIAGVMTPNAFLSEWRFVFWITFSLHMAEAIVFTIFGSAEVQPWNSISRQKPNV